MSVFAKDKKQPKWEVTILRVGNVRETMDEDIAAMLNEGWELFSHVVFQDNSEHFYFKRLAPDKPDTK